jgi:two-component system chemotaxis response regulator CheY
MQPLVYPEGIQCKASETGTADRSTFNSGRHAMHRMDFVSRQIDWTLPVLVADDSRATANIAMRILREIGFSKAECCGSGVDTLMKLRGNRYGLLLTDLEMPGLSGLDLIRCIRGDPQLSNLPIVLMTAKVEIISRMISHNERSAADIHILKPFTAQSLMQKIEDRFGPPPSPALGT